MNRKKILLGTDTVSGIAPQILKAIKLASEKNTSPYGKDIFTDKCKNCLDPQRK